MTKLRLSDHRLAIETGRYMRPYKKPNERICSLGKKEVEDEKHFLASFPAYREKKKSLFKCLHNDFKILIAKIVWQHVYSRGNFVLKASHLQDGDPRRSETS